MNFLEERIVKDGIVKEGNVLKVDSFLNHQMDIKLLNQMGAEFKKRFADRQSCGRTFYCKTVRKIDGGKKYCQQLIRVILEIFVL